MAQAFNLTAQINLRGPANVRTVVADIRRQIGTINANINFRLDPNAARNVTQLNANLRTLNTTFGTTATAANNAANALRNFGNAVNNINARNLPQTLNSAAAATARLNQQASQASRSLQQAHSEMQEFGKQSGLAIRRFAAFSTVTGVIYGLTNAINQGVRAYIEYDRQLVKLQQVTGQSAKGLSSLESSITNLSTKLGVASSDLTEIASTLAQAGLSAKDTERAMKALALSSLAPSFDSMNETVEGSIALMRQFGIGAGELEKALGSVNSVAAKFAVESADIITAIQRTGGVFAAASKGVSEGTDALNEFIAVFTSVRATTRESAETIATGLRTIFTRIQRGSTIDALKEYGVNLQDLDGKFVGAYKAVELLSKGLSKLDPRDIRFSQIVEELGGFRQIGKVIPLIQQFATAQDALKVAQKGQGSLVADAAKAQESLAVQIVKVREEFLALFREIGKSDSFQTIAKGALDVTSALIKAADSVKGILPVLGVLFAFKGASALTQFTRGFTGGVRGGSARAAQAQAPAGRGFASGGLVPGSGDGDTVPAMLTPGEFVIRKKAVAAIGAQNLHNINKYASGGIVQEKAVGAAILKGKTSRTDQITKSQILASKKGADTKAVLDEALSGKDSFTYIKEPLSKDVYIQFKNAINHGIVTGLNKAVGVLSSSIPGVPSKAVTPPKKNINNFLATINEGAKGAFFESILDSMMNKGIWKENTEGTTTPFDFPNGLSGEAAKLFPSLSGMRLVDAKASFSAAKNTGMAKKIANEILKEKTGFAPGTKKTSQNYLGSLVNMMKPNVKYDLNSIKSRIGLSNLKRDMVLELASMPDSPIKVLQNKPLQIQLKQLGGKIQKLTSGGAINDKIITRGTIKYKLSDIIKAGLTEAEFMEQIPTPGSVFPQWKIGGYGPGSKPFPRFLQPYTEPSKFEQEMAKAQAAKMERISGLMNKRGRTMRDYEGRSNDEKLFRKARGFSSGGSAEDTVPALLTPGEFVINKKAAQRLGSAKLHQLNNADKIQGFNKGGAVQRFASGGPTLEARPQNANLDTVRVPQTIVADLQNINQALNNLGISATNSSKLLEQQGDINYREAQRALQLDITRMRTAGASADDVATAENRLNEIRRQATSDINTRRTLGNTNGQQLQEIENRAQANRARGTALARASGMTDDQINDPVFQRRLTNRSYFHATEQVTGRSRASLAAQGISGDNIQQYIRQSMMDRRTLSQMDKTFINQRRQELFNQLRAETGATASRQQIRALAQQAEKMAVEEANARRQTLNAIARQNNLNGPGSAGLFARGGMLRYSETGFNNLGASFGGLGGRIMGGINNFRQAPLRSLSGLANGLNQSGFYVSSALGLVAGQGENIAGALGKTGRDKAGLGAKIESGVGTVAGGLALTTSIAPLFGPAAPIALAVGAVATGIYAWNNSLKASQDAIKAFEQNLRSKEIESAADKTVKAFTELEKDPTNKGLQRAATDSVITQGRLTQNDNNILLKDAQGKGPEAFKNAVEQAAKAAEPASEASQRLVESMLRAGKSVGEIANDPAFTGLIETIAQSDKAYQANQALLQQGVRGYTEEQMAVIKNKIAYDTLNGAVAQSIIRTNEAAKALDAVNKAGYRLTISFDRMINTFNQSLSKTRFDSNARSDSAVGRFEALGGKAEVRNMLSRDENILTNPKVYDDKTKQNTYSRIAGGITGNANSAEAKDIISILSTDFNKISQNIVGSIQEKVGNNKENTTNIQLLKRTAMSQLKESTKGLPAVVQEEMSRKLEQIISDIKQTKPENAAQELKDRIEKELGVAASETANNVKNMGMEFAKFSTDSWNQFISATNAASEAQLKFAEYSQKAADIQTNANVSLRELRSGGSIGLGERSQIFNTRIAGMTGGLTDPNQIKNQIDNLSKQAEAKQKIINETTDKDVKAKAISEMSSLNNQIRQSRSALEELANSTEVLNAAMQQLQNVQKMQADRLANVDKLLTSTPEELETFNESLVRLQQRVNGVNPNPSKAAQQAYLKTLRETGGNVYLAQRAGYGQMAKDRASDLQNMEQYKSTAILQMTNQGATEEQANTMFKVFEEKLRTQMANESGLAGNPLVSQAIQAITRPEVDSSFGQAQGVYGAAAQRQATANQALGKLEKDRSTELLIASQDNLREAFKEFVNTYGAARKEELGMTVKPQQRALGGSIYASSGKLVNFEPKGSDTVPAMLTPGEFVVNARATTKNLPLLKAINSGHMSTGGMVYLANGGKISAVTFNRLDRNKDGFLDANEAGNYISLDFSKDGKLSLSEFLSSQKQKGPISRLGTKENSLREAYRRGVSDSQVRAERKAQYNAMMSERKNQYLKSRASRNPQSSGSRVKMSAEEKAVRREDYLAQLAERERLARNLEKDTGEYNAKGMITDAEGRKRYARPLSKAEQSALDNYRQTQADAQNLKSRTREKKVFKDWKLQTETKVYGTPEEAQKADYEEKIKKIDSDRAMAAKRRQEIENQDQQRREEKRKSDKAEFNRFVSSLNQRDPALEARLKAREEKAAREKEEAKNKPAVPKPPAQTDTNTMPPGVTISRELWEADRKAEEARNKKDAQRDAEAANRAELGEKIRTSRNTQPSITPVDVMLAGGRQALGMKTDDKTIRNSTASMVGNAVLDPTNWLPIGGAGMAVGAGVKAVGKQVAKETAEYVVRTKAASAAIAADKAARQAQRIATARASRISGLRGRIAEAKAAVEDRLATAALEQTAPIQRLPASSIGPLPNNSVITADIAGFKASQAATQGASLLSHSRGFSIGSQLLDSGLADLSRSPVIKAVKGVGSFSRRQSRRIGIGGAAIAGKTGYDIYKDYQSPQPKQYGGLIYASNGALIGANRQGTDSVPAMLTPGEFVVNRESAQHHMPLLKAINSGHMNYGGIVKYLAQGGSVAPRYYAAGGTATGASGSLLNLSGLSDMVQGIKEAFGSLENLKTVGETIKSAASTMMNSASAYSEAANNMPNQLTANVTNDTRVHHMGLDRLTGNLEQNIYQNTKKDSQQISHNSLSQLDRKLEGGLGYMS